MGADATTCLKSREWLNINSWGFCGVPKRIVEIVISMFVFDGLC